MISTLKVMVSIFWSLFGFPVVPALPPRTRFTTAHCCGDIIPKIVEGMSFDLGNSPTTDAAHGQRHLAPSPGIDRMSEEIPNPSNRSPFVLPGLEAL
jgi:hypothetical protein